MVDRRCSRAPGACRRSAAAQASRHGIDAGRGGTHGCSARRPSSAATSARTRTGTDKSPSRRVALGRAFYSPVLGTGPSDTMSTFAIQKNGSLKLVQLAPSGGWSPRQFSINRAGDLLAIGHQNNNTVVIWKRDVASGKIVLEADGGKVGQVKLSGAVVSTIFDE